MDKTNIFVIALVVAALAFRLYTRYVKKGTNKTTDSNHQNKTGNEMSGDDDYEPYSGK